MPTKPIPEQTLREMEAGRKRVFNNTVAETTALLKKAGMTVEVEDLTTLMFHLAVARHAGVLDISESKYACRKCGLRHHPMRDCPNIGQGTELSDELLATILK